MLGGRASRDRSRRGDHAARWRTTPRNLATLSLPSGGRRCSRCHAAANALLLCLLLTAVDQDRRSAALLTLLFFVLLLFLFRLFLLLCCSTLSGHRYRLLEPLPLHPTATSEENLTVAARALSRLRRRLATLLSSFYPVLESDLPGTNLLQSLSLRAVPVPKRWYDTLARGGILRTPEQLQQRCCKL